MRHRPRPFHGTQCSLVRTDLLSEKQRNRPGARLAESSVATGHPAETTAHRQGGRVAERPDRRRPRYWKCWVVAVLDRTSSYPSISRRPSPHHVPVDVLNFLFDSSAWPGSSPRSKKYTWPYQIIGSPARLIQSRLLIDRSITYGTSMIHILDRPADLFLMIWLTF
jgi:hypothetical protein